MVLLIQNTKPGKMILWWKKSEQRSKNASSMICVKINCEVDKREFSEGEVNLH